MGTSELLLAHRDARGVCRLTLNRPATLNALDAALAAALLARLEAVAKDPEVRVVVLSGRGEAFCSGADIHWMRELQAGDPGTQRQAAELLVALMARLDGLPRPTVARVHGSAYGGGAGLVSCCDIAVASLNARFAFSEARLGLAPVVIAPYVIRAIGGHQARRYFLSAETIDARTGERIGLVHRAVPAGELEQAVEAQVELLLRGGPGAQELCKRLAVRGRGRPDSLASAERLAALWGSAEAREGLSAFAEKRRPVWWR